MTKDKKANAKFASKFYGPPQTIPQNRGHTTGGFWVSCAAVLISLLTFTYTVWHDHRRDTSTDRRDTSTDSRLGKLEATVRLLAATVAPQLQHEVDETLRSAVIASKDDAATLATTAQNDLANLRKLSAPLPADKSEQLAASAQNLVNAHPDITSVWGATAELVSYRSGSYPQPQLPDCFQQIKQREPTDPIDMIRYSRCRLDLADVIDGSKNLINVSQASQNGAPSAFGTITPRYILYDASIVYKGGPLMPFSLIECYRCRVDFAPTHDVPSLAEQHLLRTLLAADPHDFQLRSTPETASQGL